MSWHLLQCGWPSTSDRCYAQAVYDDVDPLASNCGLMFLGDPVAAFVFADVVIGVPVMSPKVPCSSVSGICAEDIGSMWKVFES
jgi:hypothetical protein